MIRTTPTHLAAITLFCCCTAPAEEPKPARPFPQHTAYTAGTILPTHRTQDQLDDDIRVYYDRWKRDYLKPAGTGSGGRPLFRIAFDKEGDQAARTVSEGQGYGMVIVATLAGHDPEAKRIFDGLHAFALAYPSSKDARLMAWEVPSKADANSAFDGDADIAHALLLAHAQWGSSGDSDYAAAARTRLAGILASTIGPDSHLPMLGDWVRPDDPKANQHTPRSSDFMPGHFRPWARFTRDPTWLTVAENSARTIGVLQENFSPGTGLLPDFIVGADSSPKPAPAKFLEGAHDGAFYYNAGRVPWRLAADALLHGDKNSAAQARKISRWAREHTAGDPTKFRSGYGLDGTPLPGSDYFSSFFAAPVGVAAMLDPENPSWLHALYDSVRESHTGYYEDTVTLQCLIAMSGNLWDPTASGANADRSP